MRETKRLAKETAHPSPRRLVTLPVLLWWRVKEEREKQYKHTGGGKSDAEVERRDRSIAWGPRIVCLVACMRPPLVIRHARHPQDRRKMSESTRSVFCLVCVVSASGCCWHSHRSPNARAQATRKQDPAAARFLLLLPSRHGAL
jgi:hypothetical protein